jgi:hypothetical protein
MIEQLLELEERRRNNVLTPLATTHRAAYDHVLTL